MFRITKRLKLPVEGDLFAVPLRDGSFGFVQLVQVWRDGTLGSPTYLAFGARAGNISQAEAQANELDLSKPNFGCTSDGEEVEKRLWPQLGCRPVVFPGIEHFKSQIGTWGWWKGSELGYLEMFLSAFFGIIPPYKTYERDLARLSLEPAGLPSRTVNNEDEGHRQGTTSDEAMVRHMTERGDDGNSLRPVVHYLLLGEEQQLPETLSNVGVVENADGIVCITQQLRRAEILENVSLVRSLASAAGLEYDGWEAQIARPKSKP